jgi:hypothetical protein
MTILHGGLMLQAAIPSSVVNALTILIAFAGIVAFAGMFGWGMYKVWTKNPKPDSDAFIYVATALAALIGGIVAVGFGQKPPAFASATIAHNASALGIFLTSLPNWGWAEVLGGIYATIYVVFGIAAIVTWVVGPANPTPPIVKNLATTFLGMALPIIASFFREAPK